MSDTGMSQYRERLEKALTGFFDIEHDKNVAGIDFDTVGVFHQRDAKYILSKEAEIYAFQTNENIYFKEADSSLERADIEACHDYVKENIDDIVDMNDEHMATVITFIFAVEGTPDKEVLNAVEKFNFHKSFKFGLKGYADARVFIVDTATEDVYSNNFGKKDRKKILFKPIKRRRNPLDRIFHR